MKPNLESIKEDIQKTKRPLIVIIIFLTEQVTFMLVRIGT